MFLKVATLGYALYDGVGMMSWVGKVSSPFSPLRESDTLSVSKYRSLMSSCKVPEEKHEQVWMDQLVNVLLYQYTHSSHTSMLMYKVMFSEFISYVHLYCHLVAKWSKVYLRGFRKTAEQAGMPNGYFFIRCK